MKIKNTVLTSIFALCGASAFYKAGATKMSEYKFDLGKNIHAVARESGAPAFGIEDHGGVKLYEILEVPTEVHVRYGRSGYEIAAPPLFSVTMYADTKNDDNLAVERLELNVSPNAAKTHDEARAVVTSLISQFAKGKWRRHISDACQAVTGRSSYLDKSGNVNAACPLDPGHEIPLQDWLTLMPMTQRYEWLGDGVLAVLVVRFANDSRGLTYTIDLDFQDFTIQTRDSGASEARRLAEGDRKGWRSTEDHKRGGEQNRIDIKILEDNAVRRGDRVVPRI